MPRELRFCRNCGFRLGEGTAEYTETVRFQNAPPAAVPGNNPAGFGYVAPIAPLAPYAAMPLKKRKRKLSGMTWMFLILLIFFVTAAVFTAVVRSPRGNMPAGITSTISQRSFVGVDGFDSADEGGVTFDSVDTPGGPADLAGLVGGDRIITFDGQNIEDEDKISDILQNTPIGKTVDVVYIRDGETKNTKLTTISRQDHDRLVREFRGRPEGRALFGYEESDSERVPIPGTNLFGVRLDNLSSSMPADMAGIKEGDVVVEFDGIPIRTTDELLSRIRRAIPYSIVKVVVMRNNEKLEIPVKMGKS